MSVINSQPLIGASGQAGYFLDRSLRFRSSASAYLSRTNTATGNAQKFTWSAWVKRGSISSASDQWLFCSSNFNTSSNVLNFGIIFKLGGGAEADTLVVGLENTVSGTNGIRRTTQVFRDPSAWYHIVGAVDTTQATASNRIKVYVNGTEVTAFAVNTDVAQNTNVDINQNGGTPRVGAFNLNGSPQRYFDGYMAEINFIDGQALTPSSFGETSASTGVWIPKKYTGTYGTNGFYLDFKDNSALTTSSNAGLGKDNSGNGNYWTTNNISITSGSTYDSMTDVPTLTSATAANYAVMNPLDKGGDITVANGNLSAQAPTTGGSNFVIRSSIGMSSGKWYWEVTPASLGGTAANNTMCGLILFSSAITGYLGSTATGYGYYGSNGQKYNNNSASAYGASYTSTDVIGVAFDADNGTLTFYKNNVSQGTAFTGLTAGTYFAATGNGNSSSYTNFGQQPFVYTPPSGFVALNTFNLPTPTIGATPSSQANDYFDATTYTATGTTQAVVNSGGMQPDFVWIKPRSIVGTNLLFDSIRGVTKYLESNSTNAETTDTTNFFNSFNSNGFSQGTGNYANGTTVVAWQWRASNATGVTNTAGSITSTVSANTTAGFSIVTWTGNGITGATIGHGLGAVPRMIIAKTRSIGQNWIVYRPEIGAANVLLLNSSSGSFADGAWNSTTPTSSVFTVNNGQGVNQNAATYVAYCFAEVAGYSRFGSYTGNGSSDGPFVFCGFRPRFLLVKRTDVGGSWYIWDTSRNSASGGNVMGYQLYPDLSNAESGSGTDFDFLSNGFKTRGSYTDINGNGGTYIYAAFAESPFKFSNAR